MNLNITIDGINEISQAFEKLKSQFKGVDSIMVQTMSRSGLQIDNVVSSIRKSSSAVEGLAEVIGNGLLPVSRKLNKAFSKNETFPIGQLTKMFSKKNSFPIGQLPKMFSKKNSFPIGQLTKMFSKKNSFPVGQLTKMFSKKNSFPIGQLTKMFSKSTVPDYGKYQKLAEVFAMSVIPLQSLVKENTALSNILSTGIGYVVGMFEAVLALKDMFMFAKMGVMGIFSTLLKLKSIFAALGAAIAGLSWPVILVVAGIAAAVALIIVYWDEIVNYFRNVYMEFSEIFGGIAQAWNNLFGGQEDPIKKAGEGIDWLGLAIDGAKKGFEVFGFIVQHIFNSLLMPIKIVLKAIEGIINTIDIVKNMDFFNKIGDFFGWGDMPSVPEVAGLAGAPGAAGNVMITVEGRDNTSFKVKTENTENLSVKNKKNPTTVRG